VNQKWTEEKDKESLPTKLDHNAGLPDLSQSVPCKPQNQRQSDLAFRASNFDSRFEGIERDSRGAMLRLGERRMRGVRGVVLKLV